MAFSLSAQTLDSRHLRPVDPKVGAVVLFEGRVRDFNEGRPVVSLEYTAYEALACKEGERLLAEAIALHQVHDIEVVHRVGALAIGDVAVVVRVLAVHRKEAFEACQWVMDQLKQRVPIWKNEHYSEGSRWL